jgi:peptidoglycan/LPS O-acetylase OafA/YrhL
VTGPTRADAKAYRPQLDALRAIAVGAVLVQHTVNPQALLVRDAGYIGVMLFFVLSGFLITGILLEARDEAEAAGAGRLGVLLRFYVRRFLRIFPLYYGVIGIAFVLGHDDVVAHWPALVTYRTNFLLAEYERLGAVTPFWSLAVEEQFYLAWPLVVLFAPRRLATPVIGLMVIGSVVSRGLITHAGGTASAAIMPTWSCLDGLALGAGLALYRRRPARSDIVATVALAFGIALLGIRLGGMAVERGRTVLMGIHMLPWGLIGVWLVDRAASDRLPRVFRWRPLVALGTVSYGVYVYHRFVMDLLGVGSARGVHILIAVSALTVGIAVVSWLAFERPINRLKHFWPYVRRVPRPAAETVYSP